MQTSAKRPRSVRPAIAGTSAEAGEAALRAFLGTFDAVFVAEPATLKFPGCVSVEIAKKYWTWVCRDIVPDAPATIVARMHSGESAAKALDAVLPSVIELTQKAAQDARLLPEGTRRFAVQMGGSEVHERLDLITVILSSRGLIEKARAFGKTSNSIQGDQAMAQALQSIPIDDPAQAAPIMHAMVGQVTAPSRLITAVIYLSGRPSEDAVRAAGFGPLVEAIFAHAQSQLSGFSVSFGVFADIDLVCRNIDRFHRLMRSVNEYIDLERFGRWATTSGTLITRVSERIAPHLREVTVDVSQSLRRSRDGSVIADEERLLKALNGMYVLAAVREARDSLAVNALFERTWTETGQALESMLARNLDDLRADPGSAAIAKKLQSGIKMGELRFGADYAAVMTRAFESIARRSSSSPLAVSAQNR